MTHERHGRSLHHLFSWAISPPTPRSTSAHSCGAALRTCLPGGYLAPTLRPAAVARPPGAAGAPPGRRVELGELVQDQHGVVGVGECRLGKAATSEPLIPAVEPRL